MYELPKLPYDLGALEPVISKEIMDLHYNKHHKAYVTNLNAALEKLKTADLKEQIALQAAIKFNGGGHINHTLFWENLAPGGNKVPGKLGALIDKEFGSFSALQEKFSAAAVGVQGSGWAWLGFNKAQGRLEIATCANQDPLLGLVPLIGIDVWEHAYYLQYKNVRADYVKAIYQVLNWEKAEERLAL